MPPSVPTTSSSAQALADYVLSKGLTNLQQYSWWSNNPNKTAAWSLVQSKSQPSPAPAKPAAWTYANASATDLLELIKSGKLVPDPNNPQWTAGYVNGAATPVMRDAYKLWEDYQRNNRPPPSTAPRVEIPTGNAGLPTVSIPQELADDPSFRQLGEEDPEMQSLVGYFWSLMESGNEKQVAAFDQALNLASEQAGPYWREKINVIKDELSRSLGSLDANLGEREAELIRRRDRINEDLQYGKAELSLDEQTQLAAQRDLYDQQILDVRENMAQRGFTSSSFRDRAETNVNRANTNVIESVERAAERKRRELQVSSDRTLEDDVAALAELRRRTQEGKTDVIRKAESYLGSSELESLPGTGGFLSGGISGGLVEDKGSDILKRAEGLL